MVPEIPSHLPESFKVGDEPRRTGLRVDETRDRVSLVAIRAERPTSI